MTYLEELKKIIDFKSLINKTVSYRKGKNSIYFTADIIDFMINAVILGYARFSLVDDLCNDSDYLKIKDSDLTSEKVCRDLLKALPDEAKDEFREANKNILALKS